MSSQRAQLSNAAVQFTREQQAAFARQLIVANEHYRLSNSADLALDIRMQHRMEARNLAEEVAAQDPNNASVMNLLGRIALDDNNMVDATGYMLAAIEQAPENAGYYVNLGYVRLAAREYEQAEALFAKALELQKNNAQAYGGIAYALLRKGDYLGAFLRLRSLIEKGQGTAYGRRALFDAAQHLWADHYDVQLEQDLISYYGWPDGDALQLGNLTASILIHKYDLSNDEAPLELDALAQDPLLLAALQRSLLANRLVESLLTVARQSVLYEVCSTRQLRDSLQPFVCALAEYCARTGYAFAVNEDEAFFLGQLQQEIHDTLQDREWQQQDAIGALLVVALYEPLYGQPYTFQLLRDDLGDWPEAVQAVLQAALYEPSSQHLMQYEISGGDAIEALAATPMVRGMAPYWETLGMHPSADYREALARELGESHSPTTKEQLQVLVAGCRSGQRAISLARFFEGVEVTAVDSNLDNIVHAVRAAHRYELNNINFHCLPLQQCGQAGKGYDVIECGQALGPVEQVADTMRHLAGLLNPNGVIRFALPRRAGRQQFDEARNRLREQDILPTPDNVRSVRQIVLEEAAQGGWQDIVANPEFYTLPGARDLLFADDEPSFNLMEVQSLLQTAGLEFIGFVDLDANARQRVQTLRPQDLAAWHSLDERHHTVFGDTYEIYCRRV